MATVRIHVDATHSVSALMLEPRDAIACLVLAHGAGAGMTHPFMDAAAQGLAARRIATLRYQFPYMEQGSKRPTVRRSHRQRCALRPPKQTNASPNYRYSPAANRSAAA